MADDPDDRGKRAARRAAAAAERAEELKERLSELRDGTVVNIDDAERARAAARKAAERAAEGRHSAEESIRRSREAHEDVAATLDETGQHARAEEHRRAADEDAQRLGDGDQS